MRVAFITRSTLCSVPGGDTIQALFTAEHLRRAGVEVDVLRNGEPVKYERYDLLHFFNIIRPADILPHITCGKPYVVSTIFADYSEFEKKYRSGWTGGVFRWLPPAIIEYGKTVARAWSGTDKLCREYLRLGHVASMRKVIRHSACLLPNSNSEYLRLRQACGLEHAYTVVPNGIDEQLFTPMPGTAKDDGMVVCAARIEGIKNQLNLIRALNGTRFRLYLIGDAAPHHKAYYRQCKKMAADNIIFLDHLPQVALRRYYARAKVHALPSWFETTGLSSLEAAAMGCNIVAGNRGDAVEYFGTHAHWCDPASPRSIYEAVEKAAVTPVNTAFAAALRRKFTWRQAASASFQAYQSILCALQSSAQEASPTGMAGLSSLRNT